MAYTVKKMSELSGVSVRTLHFYEEINILRPSYYGGNGYRYYEEKELLQLQQILFFKELGFSLKQIQKVLGKSDFNQLAALNSHRKALSQEKQKIAQLIKTVDKTIKHLTGDIKMSDKEFFKGFSEVKFNPATASAAETLVVKNLRTLPESKKDKAFREKININANEILRKIVSCIDKGFEPDHKEVQQLIKEHHAFADQFHVAMKEVYLALAELYKGKAEFRNQLDFFHPKLAEFMSKAMVIFAENKLN